jgi:hypothetical protein
MTPARYMCAIGANANGDFFPQGASDVQTFISVKELIPTALKYDPHNRVTSSCIVLGMVIISASLLLFTI